MTFATGGFAYGGVSSRAKVAGTAFNVSKNTVGTGWTAGGGIEYAVTENVSFKTEYLYVDLGKSNLFNGTIGGIAVNAGIKTTEQLVRAGVNLRLGAM